MSFPLCCYGVGVDSIYDSPDSDPQRQILHQAIENDILHDPIDEVNLIAVYGSTTFTRKKKTLPKDIIELKEAYGICNFKMTL